MNFKRVEKINIFILYFAAVIAFFIMKIKHVLCLKIFIEVTSLWLSLFFETKTNFDYAMLLYIKGLTEPLK